MIEKYGYKNHNNTKLSYFKSSIERECFFRVSHLVPGVIVRHRQHSILMLCIMRWFHMEDCLDTLPQPSHGHGNFLSPFFPFGMLWSSLTCVSYALGSVKICPQLWILQAAVTYFVHRSINEASLLASSADLGLGK